MVCYLQNIGICQYLLILLHLYNIIYLLYFIILPIKIRLFTTKIIVACQFMFINCVDYTWFSCYGYYLFYYYFLIIKKYEFFNYLYVIFIKISFKINTCAFLKHARLYYLSKSNEQTYVSTN